MSDISNQLIKNSYDYVLQSDLVTGVVYRIGGTVPVNPIFLSGLTINSGFTYSNGTEQNGYVLTCDASGNANWGPDGGTTGVYLPLSGGTVTGPTIFQSGLTANTISATTYYNLPVSAVTNGTGISASTSNGTVTITNTAPDQVVTISGGTGITTGGTYPNFTLVNSAPDQTVTITGGTNIQIAGTYPNFGVNYTGQTSFPYLPLSGGTVTGGTTFQSGLTATTISATTYYNLPTDVFVTGGTYTSGNAIFTNNTGGTFTVTGFAIGGGGGQLFYLNLSQSQGSNRLLSTTASTASQQTTGVTINNGVTGSIASFQSQPLNITLLPGGIWSFYLHSYKQNNNASFDIFVEVYKRTSGGTQTLLFSTDPTPVTTNSPNPSMQLSDSYFSGTTLLVSDSIVATVRATNTSNQSHTITLVTEGSTHYSYVVSTIPTQQGLTCDTLSGCTIIQTIQTDLTNKLDKSGGTISGGLVVNSGLTATTISATTYQNLPSSFQSVRISGTTQFSANTGTFINFSGVNISITSASTNTLVFSGSPQFTVPGSNNQVLTSDGSGGAVAESLLTFDGAATSPTLDVNGVTVGRGNGNLSSNISIGDISFSAVANGTNNVSLGRFTLCSNTSGNSNIGIGTNSLRNNINGNSNVAIGQLSLNKNDKGCYNVAIGDSSLSCNIKGDGNTSIGFTSLSANTTGKFNVSLGHKSMSNSQSVCYGLNYNISIGYKNMYKACGDSNISMGKFSLYNVSQCMFGNIAIGDKSLREGTCISRNIGIGDNSLKKLSTGNYNIGIGDYALYGYGCTISFSRNIALGAKSQKEKCGGDDNISVGVESLFSNCNGSKNIAIGTNAIRQNSYCSTSGIGNIGIGFDSLRKNNSASDHNIAIGQAALYYNTGVGDIGKPDFNIAIGRCAMLNNKFGCENIAIGRRALMSNAGAYSNIGCGNVALGRGTMANNYTGCYNIALGRSSLYSNTTGYHNIALGRSSGGEITTGYRNISLGYNSLYYTTTGRDNIAIGYRSLYYNSDGIRNIAIGYQSLRKSDKKSENIAIGSQTLFNWVGYGGERTLTNIAIGLGSLYGGTTNSGAPYYTTNYSKFSGNIAIGQQSQSCNYNGDLNVSLGHNTLTHNLCGRANVAIGSGALFRANGGNNNIAIGTKSIGYAGPVPVGDFNIAIGYYSFGRTSCSGNHNILLGYKSMYRSNNGGSHNIGMGYRVLYYNSGQSNISFGYKSLYQNTSGYQNIAIGNNTSSGNYNYSIILGGYATATGNNQFVVGSSSIPIGTITTESCESSKTWEIRINGNSYKVLLA